LPPQSVRAPEMLLRRFDVTSSVCGIVIEQHLLSEAQWEYPTPSFTKLLPLRGHPIRQQACALTVSTGVAD
jgi:hypothetical protein